MRLRNTTSNTIRVPQLDLLVAPGAEIEVSDRLCLRSKAHGWPGHNLTSPSIIERVAPHLVPSRDEDRDLYASTRVEDLPEVIANHEQNRQDQERQMCEVGRNVGGTFTK